MSAELIAPPAAADEELAPAGRRRLRVALTLGVLVLVLLVWELGLRVTETPAYVLPPPSLVLARLVDGLIGGSLLRHTLVTVQEILGGYLLGAALGIGLGVLISQYPLLDDILYPYVVALNSVPKVAVSPLIVLWFGLGFQSKIVIAALVAFFPLLVNVSLGLKSADPEQIDLMRGLTASRWQIFTMVQLPNALPSIFAGLEVAIVLSVVGAIVGEFVGAKEGLGYFIQLSNALVDTAGMFAAFILLALVGWLLNQAVKLAARKIVFWRRSTVIVESA
jgi:NitT/TauT family transport system permease protein